MPKRKFRASEYKPVSELDKAVEDVLQGRKVYLVPPGGSAFLVTNLFLMIGGGAGALECAVGVFGKSNSSQLGLTTLVLGVLLTLAMSTLSVLVVRGYGRAHSWFKVYSASLLGLAAVGLLASFTKHWTVSSTLAAVPVILFGLSTWCLRSRRYLLCASFMKKLNTRRRQVRAEQDAVCRQLGLNPK